MKFFHTLSAPLAIFCSVVLLASSQAFSQDGPTPEERAYKFRTSLFQTFGWKMGQLAGAKAREDGAAFIQNAKDLEYLASMIEEGFQIEGSLPEGTSAKAKIWEDFDTFSEKANTLRTAAAALTEAGAMADFSPRDFGSKNCGGCHREFRVKKDG